MLIVIAAIPAILRALPSPFADYVQPGVQGAEGGPPTPNWDQDKGPDLYEAANRLANTSFLSNAELDPLYVKLDAMTKTRGATIALISRGTGAVNELGYYTDLGQGAVTTTLFHDIAGAGWFGPSYPAATFPAGTGSSFGWYLGSDVDADGLIDRVAYSENMTWEGLDDVMSYYLGDIEPFSATVNGTETVLDFDNAFLVGFEDGTEGGGEGDYNDVILVIEPSAPVPEPATLLLVGIGTLGLCVRRRRQGRR